MSLIRILSDDLINKIAAGEVIERPASVVKELVENSLDAGGTDIRVDVSSGGKGVIKVSDNGSGMGFDDALNSVKRHATSKIREENDLYNISTMGFRGEALSSIASVSVMKITTALKGSVGTVIEIEGGEIKRTGETAAFGTVIEIRELFYNTPVRKKFLKADSTELYHIIDSVTQASLAYPERGFTLFSESREVLKLPACSSQAERISQLHGSEFLKGLNEFESKSGIFSVRGFVSKENNYRKSRSLQYMFLNRRAVRDNSLRHAIYQAYKELLPDRHHPVFFVSLFISPELVDVNVHPQKKEIRFVDGDGVYRFIRACARDAVLGQRDTQEGGGVHNSLDHSYKGFTGYEGKEKAHPTSRAPYNIQSGTGGNPSIMSDSDSGLAGSYSAEFKEQPPMPYRVNRSFVYAGDVYALYPEKEGIYIMDHHASHERVLYEKLSDTVKLDSHRLLFPQHVRMPKKEFTLIADRIDVIRAMGIDLDEFGEDTFIVRSLPMELEEADLSDILSEIALSFIEIASDSPVDLIKDAVAKKIACHSSVRGKTILSNEELNRLLHDLDSAKDPWHCPHGRPTRIFISQGELRKMFKRK